MSRKRVKTQKVKKRAVFAKRRNQEIDDFCTFCVLKCRFLIFFVFEKSAKNVFFCIFYKSKKNGQFSVTKNVVSATAMFDLVIMVVRYLTRCAAFCPKNSCKLCCAVFLKLSKKPQKPTSNCELNCCFPRQMTSHKEVRKYKKENTTAILTSHGEFCVEVLAPGCSQSSVSEPWHECYCGAFVQT